MPGPGSADLSEGGPSRSWYGVGAAVLLLGIVTAALLVLSVVRDVAGVTRFSTSQPVEADLPAQAERTIYREDGQSLLSAPVACEVSDLTTGERVAVTPNEGFSFEHSDEALVSMVRFRTSHAGRYRVSCSTDSTQPIDLAVGPRIRIFRSIGRVFGAGAAGLVALATAVAIVAFTAVKRHEHRRRARTS